MTTPKREIFDEIFNSIENGQYKQSVEQMEDMGLKNMSDLLQYIEQDLGKPEVALHAAKIFFTFSY